jgi:hypothetical protein
LYDWAAKTGFLSKLVESKPCRSEIMLSPGTGVMLAGINPVPLPAVMGRLTAAPSGDEESPGNAEHLAS